MLLRMLLGATMLAPFLLSTQITFAGDTFYACAKKNNGQLRMVEAPGQCRKSEYELTWSDGQDYEQRINELLGRVAALEFALGVINQAPTVNAGNDQTILVSIIADLSGTATDDGLLRPLTYWWEAAAGPNGVSFVSPDSLSTQVSFAVPGNYELRLTVDDGAVTVSDSVNVTVYPDNTPPVITTAGTQVIPAERLQISGDWVLRCKDLTLDATVADDGLPLPLSYNWEIVEKRMYGESGPSYCTELIAYFSDSPAEHLDWPFTVMARPHPVPHYQCRSYPKSYLPKVMVTKLAVSASDGYFTADGELTVQCDVTASDVPVVDAGEGLAATGEIITSDGAYACRDLPLSGWAEDDGLPEYFRTSWRKVGTSPATDATWTTYARFDNASATDTNMDIEVRHIGPSYYWRPLPNQVTVTIELWGYDGHSATTDTVQFTCSRP